jgi:chromosome segregation ATPase
MIAGAVLVMVMALAGLFLLTRMSRDLREMDTKLNKLDAMTVQIQRMSTSIGRFDETNARLTSVDKSTRYLPALAVAAKGAMLESIAANAKLNIANARLAGTNLYLRTTADRLQLTNGNLTGMRADIAHVGGSMDKMTAQLTTLDDMRRLLAQTNVDLDKTTDRVGQATAGVGEMRSGLDEMRVQMKSMNSQLGALALVSSGIEKMQSRLETMNSHLTSLPQMKGDLDDMQAQLRVMNSQLAFLPQMKQSLDNTNTTLAQTAATLQPLGQSLPQMNVTMQQMNQTTTEMARSLRKLPGQGALGVAALVAAELFGGK